MREILFRGKRLDNGNWVQGSIFTRINEVYIFPLPITTSKSEVDPATVGQYTGLTDKNGKKIFEGDVIALERGWGEKVIYTIEYDTECCCFIGDSVNYIGFTTFENDGDRIEVIGNIHDNPESLGGADNG